MNVAQTKLHDAAMRIFAERGATDLNVSELAAAAGVARGTVYNNLKQPEALFEEVAANLANEMHRRVAGSYVGIEDPASRLSVGMRFFIRRAHEEPHWGRFIIRFAFTTLALQGMWAGPPAEDLKTGLADGRYTFAPEQFASMLAHVAGATLSAMFLVLDGHETWRTAGSNAVEFAMRSLGLSAEDAAAVAAIELPPLVK